MIEVHDELESTQTVAHQRAEALAPHGTVVRARIQTAGRGTRGRDWASGAGGLWLSVVLRPDRGADLPLASLRTGLALAGRLDRLLRIPVRLKWPNDLIVAERKLGGVLCESRWLGDRLGWLVTGVGINVQNVLPDALAGTAVRLADVGFAGSADDLMGEVIEAVLAASAQSGPLQAAELADFQARDWLAGRRLTGPIDGVATGISPEGRLRVRRPDGSVEETVASVTLAGLAPGEASR